MPKQLFTAADIRSIAHEKKCDFLILDSSDIITPEAVDVARELGVRLEKNTFSNLALNPDIENKKLIPTGTLPLHPLKMVLGSGVVLDPFGEGLSTPGTNVRLKDVITSADGSTIAAGFMTLEKGQFPWTLTYDEVDVVLEGQLIITRGEVSVSGNPGDIIFIPKGSSITFGTDEKVRFAYIAFPANWNDQA